MATDDGGTEQKEDYGSTRDLSVELLQDLLFFRTCLRVYVLSDDGWSCVLAWAQLGVESVFCVAFGELAVS